MNGAILALNAGSARCAHPQADGDGSFASDAARRITGTIVPVDGGQHLLA